MVLTAACILPGEIVAAQANAPASYARLVAAAASSSTSADSPNEIPSAPPHELDGDRQYSDQELHEMAKTEMLNGLWEDCPSIKEKFALFGREMTPNNERQAMVPELALKQA